MNGVFAGIVFSFIYWGGLASALIKSHVFTVRFKDSKKYEIVFGIAISLLFCLLFKWKFFLNDNYIPISDFGYYWVKTINFSRELYKYDIFSAMYEVYESINSEDHNNLFAAIYSPIALAVGNRSYNLYRMSLFVFFQLPACYISAIIIAFILEAKNYTFVKTKLLFDRINFEIIFSFFTICCFPVIWVPTLGGLYDVAAYLVLVCLILFLLKKDYSELDCLDSIIVITLVLMLLFIRRHFIYFLITFLSVKFVVEGIYILSKKNYTELKKLIFICIRLLIVTVSILFLGFHQYWERVVYTNYRFAYQMYSIGSFADKWWECIKDIGVGIVIMAFGAYILLCKKKQAKNINILLFSAIICMAYFFHTQSPSVQHYYNFIAQFVILSVVFVCLIIEKLNYNYRFIIICVVYFSVGFVSFIYNIDEAQYLGYSNSQYNIKYRKDINAINQIVRDINELPKQDEMVYITAASSGFNEDTLRYSQLPYITNACEKLYPASVNDLGVGFPIYFFNADWLITTDKPIYWNNHMRKYSRISWGLNELVNKKDGELYDNYKTIRTYKIDNDVEVYLKRKVIDLEKRDVDYLRDYYDKYYKNYPDLFDNVFDKYLQEHYTYINSSITSDGCIELTDNMEYTQFFSTKYDKINTIIVPIGTNGKKLAGGTVLELRVLDMSNKLVIKKSIDLEGFSDFDQVVFDNLGLDVDVDTKYKIVVSKINGSDSVLLLTANMNEINNIGNEFLYPIECNEENFSKCISLIIVGGE